jgi:hypothetical protein
MKKIFLKCTDINAILVNVFGNTEMNAVMYWTRTNARLAVISSSSITMNQIVQDFYKDVTLLFIRQVISL